MKPRCPLCLIPLDHNTRFLRFCTEHPPTGRVADEIGFVHGDTGTFLRNLRCRTADCPGNRGTGVPGVFLAHVGCAHGLDPFSAPGASPPQPHHVFSRSGNRAVHPTSGATEQVGHWQMSLHEKIEAAFGDARPAEAFFPAALMRSLVEDPEESDERRGALVGLIGSKGVGKTVLALQALDADGYPRPTAIPGLGRLAGDYLYCSPEAPGAGQIASTYLKTLRMKDLMTHDATFLSWVDGTPVMERNLKAAFFAPGAVGAAPKEQPQLGLFGRLGGELRQVGGFLQNLAGAVGPISSHRSVAFYDLAGEVAGVAADPHVGSVGGGVDVLAIVISWDELTGSSGGLGFAVARLDDAIDWKRKRPKEGVRCAVVVTKADLSAGTDPDVFRRIRAGQRARDRELLLGVIPTIATTGPLGTLERLEDHLRLPASEVDDVFFVWTADLGHPAPRSHGLVDFVQWCVLGKRVP